jgi:hypothetical protein
MAHIPFAFSIHHFVNSVGSYAGFASIIGLAILVLLYFAQARETSTLRDRADEAEQHAAQLEARLAQASRAPAVRPASAVAQRPVPSARPLVNPVAAGAGIASEAPAEQQAAMAASAGAPGAQAVAAAAAALPAAPAGVGAPALSAATRLIPAPVAAQQLAAAAPSATASPPSPPPATVAGAAALGSAGSNGPGAGTNGTSEEAAVALADPMPVAAPASLDPAPLELAEPAPEPLPRVQLRPGGAAQTRPAEPSLRRPAPPRSPSRVGRGVVLLLTALGVAVVVVVLLIVTSGGGGKTASTGGSQTTNAPSAGHRVKAKSFNTSAVTVAVLNGTATSGAAALLSGQLAGFGYKRGPTTNAANQTQTSTVVMYLPGHQRAGAAVAKSLKLASSAVQPIDSSTQAIACPQATSCTVDVVVTVGQDLAK